MFRKQCDEVRERLLVPGLPSVVYAIQVMILSPGPLTNALTISMLCE